MAKKNTARVHKMLTFFGCLLLVLAAGCKEGDLSERPERYSTAPTFAATVSTVGAVVTLPLAEVAALVNGRIPASFSDRGHGKNLCVDLGLLGKHCAGTRYKFTARKDGDVVVSALDSQTLRLKGRVKFSGNGGLRGNGAKYIDADAKNFEGTIVLNIDLKLDVDDRWCPVTEVSVGYEWSRTPRVEIVDGVWVNIENQVGTPIDNALAGVEREIESALDCSLLRPPLEGIYRTYAVPVTVPTGPAYVNVAPEGIGFSGLTYSGAEARLGASVRARVELAEQPIGGAVVPLPAPERLTDQDVSAIRLAVPIRASYGRLQEELEVALSEPYVVTTSAGQLTVLVRGVEVYPSGDRLVVGLEIEADLPSRIFDTRGRVFVMGKPVVDGTWVTVDDVGFTRQLDNEFWNIASAVLQEDILASLENAARIDLSEQFATYETMAEEVIEQASAGSGVTVDLENVALELGRVVPVERELIVEGLMSGEASVAVQSTGALVAEL